MGEGCISYSSKRKFSTTNYYLLKYEEKILVAEFNYKYDDISIIALKDKNMKEIEKYLKKYKR